MSIISVIKMEKIIKEIGAILEAKTGTISEVLVAALYDEADVDVLMDVNHLNLVYKEDYCNEFDNNLLKLFSFNHEDFNRLDGETQIRIEIEKFVKNALQNRVEVLKHNECSFLTADNWK